MSLLNQLKSLRGVSSGDVAQLNNLQVAGGAPAHQQGEVATVQPQMQYPSQPQPTPQSAPQMSVPQNNQSVIDYSQSVNVPCKNYNDDKGHFAYIDANTHKVSHVNLESGKLYTLDEVYELSLKYSVRGLSEEYQSLTWSQVLNDDTLYDKFGSPMFSFEEIHKALTAKEYLTQSSGVEEENKPKTDSFGLPL